MGDRTVVVCQWRMGNVLSRICAAEVQILDKQFNVMLRKTRLWKRPFSGVSPCDLRVSRDVAEAPVIQRPGKVILAAGTSYSEPSEAAKISGASLRCLGD